MLSAIVMLLATVFAMAAIAKLRSPAAFCAVLRNLIPAMVVPVAIWLVPGGELALAGWLLTGTGTWMAGVCATAMLTAFTLALLQMWRRGLKGCACFGESGESPTAIGGIGRNILLMVGASLVALHPEAVHLWSGGVTDFIGRTTIVLGCICLWPCLLALITRREFIFTRRIAS